MAPIWTIPSMNNLPLDTTRISCIAAGETYEMTDEKGNQSLTKEGQPLWYVPVLFSTAKQRPELLRVKIASQSAPKVSPGQQVKFVGLVAIVWEMNGKRGVSFKADRFEIARQ
jgi:hypothetical protein